MTKNTFDSEVEQFSAWNARLHRILREAAEPQGFGAEENVEKDNNPDAENFKKQALDLGAGLYALSAWKYPGCWESEEQGSGSAFDVIEKLEKSLDQSSDEYYKLTGQNIISKRMLAMAVYNEVAKQVFFFYADVDRVRTDPRTLELDPEQKTVMEEIFDAAKTWSRALPDDYNYKYADEPDSKWADAEEQLLNLLPVKTVADTRPAIPYKELGAPVWAHANDFSDDAIRKRFVDDPEGAELIIKRSQERALKRLEREKSKGVGREKR